MSEIEPYENSLSIEQLRSELRYYLDVHYGILYALRDVPEMPAPFVLLHLATASRWPEDSNRGKELQRKLGLDIIPPKSECECGAGVWSRIRRGLIADDGVTPVDKKQQEPDIIAKRVSDDG